MLGPHHRVHRQLCRARPPTEDVADPLVLVRLQPQLGPRLTRFGRLGSLLDRVHHGAQATCWRALPRPRLSPPLFPGKWARTTPTRRENSSSEPTFRGNAGQVVEDEPGDGDRVHRGGGEPDADPAVVQDGAEDRDREAGERDRLDRREAVVIRGTAHRKVTIQSGTPTPGTPAPSGRRSSRPRRPPCGTTVQASPSRTRWTKLPRWLRRSGPARPVQHRDRRDSDDRAEPASSSRGHGDPDPGQGEAAATAPAGSARSPRRSRCPSTASPRRARSRSRSPRPRRRPPGAGPRQQPVGDPAGEHQPGAGVRGEGDVAEAVPAQAVDRARVEQRAGLHRPAERGVHGEGGDRQRGPGDGRRAPQPAREPDAPRVSTAAQPATTMPTAAARATERAPGHGSGQHHPGGQHRSRGS